LRLERLLRFETNLLTTMKTCLDRVSNFQLNELVGKIEDTELRVFILWQLKTYMDTLRLVNKTRQRLKIN
jgi:hypothetical protein